jgi:formylglycine-generating enzyme required for sulfatase activity
MSGWDKPEVGLRGFTVAAAVAAVAVLAWTVLLGRRAHHAPERCAVGWMVGVTRCCAPGQEERGGRCEGVPDSCPEGMELQRGEEPGCVHESERVSIRGGSVLIGPTDWDSPEVERRRVVAVRSFRIDSLEVTRQRYQDCVRAGVCASLSVQAGEPGLPVTGITGEQAESFCVFSGGRLPTPHEWLFAAAGVHGRRYPWGPHGLVCRRAAYGLVHGPCASGGHSPEVGGSRPEGRSAEGLFDLAGNVAEFARQADGKLSVHGGSFRSAQASALKSWSSEAASPRDDVGFRCAYGE